LIVFKLTWHGQRFIGNCGRSRAIADCARRQVRPNDASVRPDVTCRRLGETLVLTPMLR
jgi:hypothetical protein